MNVTFLSYINVCFYFLHFLYSQFAEKRNELTLEETEDDDDDSPTISISDLNKNSSPK